MTKRGFIIRLLMVASVLAGFQVLSMEFLVFYAMRPGFEQVVVMLTKPGPVVSAFLGSFLVMVYFYIRPVANYCSAARSGKTPPESERLAVIHRALNFPWFMALFAFPFYMGGGYLGTLLVVRALGWPKEIAFYGFMGGIISCLLTAPLAVYAYHWLVQPVVDEAAQRTEHLPPALRAGKTITLKMKLIAIMTMLVIAVAGYMGVVGYINARTMLETVRAAEAGELGEEGGAASAYDVLERSMAGLLPLYLSLGAVASGLAVFVAFFAAREMGGPIKVLRDTAERVESGDYEQPVRLVTNDEMAGLAAAFNKMMTTILTHMRAMEAVVDELAAGVRDMDDAIETVRSISSEQSAGATEQATAVGQSSAIAEQILATSRQIAERASTVEEAAGSTLEACNEGEGRIEQAMQEFTDMTRQSEQVMRSMHELEERFQETYKIVEIIEGVAEQTELLAVNASLEAAGAGEAGKRFQVVAGETRRLALRTSESAREVKTMIERIQRATMTGAEAVRSSDQSIRDGGRAMAAVSEAFGKISGFARSTSRVVKEIGLSTNEQNQASSELATSISQVKDVAESVASGAKQAEKAVERLSQFAEALRSKVPGVGSK